jgi:Spy/CpxP family protein refolding chaperone
MKRICTGFAALLLLTATAQAQSESPKAGAHPPHHQKHPGAYQQLNLTPEQQAKLKTLREEYKHKAYTLRNEALPEAERRTKMQTLHKEHRASMEAILTPAQIEQLAQLKAAHNPDGKYEKRFNANGSKTHHRKEDLQEELNLTSAQQEKLGEIRKDFKTKAVSVRNNPALAQEEKQKQMQALRKAHEEAIKTVLTKEQAEKLQALRQQRAASRTR